jgi:hypothetical protein
MEWLKDLSDKLVIWFLHSTSGFGKELTPDGKREQHHWREQRRRNLQGLTLRSREKLAGKSKASL